MSKSNSEKNQDLTESFCQSENIKDNLLYIKNFDRFCIYDDVKKYHRLFSYQDMEREVYYFLKNVAGKNITLSVCRDIVLQIKFECYKRVNNFQSMYISLIDKLLNTRTNQFEDFDPQKYSFISVPITSEDVANSTGDAPPLFQKFLNEVLVNKDMTPDVGMQLLMQETFGYCLLPGTDAEACFFFIGDGANGKSKLLDILKAMVGIENCGSSSIESLTRSQFATSGLIGKRLNVCTEESSEFVKQDKFKALISGEAVDIEKKFADGFSEVLPVKYLFATNEMPSFSGLNKAFTRRINLLYFLRYFTETERDPQVANKIIEAELPQIYLWALKGARRLIDNGMKFTIPASVSDRTVEFENSLSSAVMFVREKYEDMEGGFVPNADIYSDYQKVWCGEVGKKPVSRERFFREVGKILKFEPTKQRHPETKKVVRGYQLKLKEDELEDAIETLNDQLNIQF
jgi:putative DNA primase/helicase